MLCLFNMQLSCLMCCALSSLSLCLFLAHCCWPKLRLFVVPTIATITLQLQAWRRCWRWRWWRGRQQLPVPLPTWTTSWSFPRVTGYTGAAWSGYNASKHATDDVLVSRCSLSLSFSLWILPRYLHSAGFFIVSISSSTPPLGTTLVCV